MKTQISLIVSFIGLFFRQMARAQGTITYLSNVGQASTGSEAVASNSWEAAMFVTGNNPDGYLLESVQLAMANATGNPGGFEAMIYAQYPGVSPGPWPGSSVGAVAGSLNPSTAGVYSYTPVSAMTLSPDTDYFIVLSSAEGLPIRGGLGAYEWSHAGTGAYNPTGGWVVDNSDILFSSNDGSSWGGAGEDAQFAISATAIPEPSLTSLLLLGGGLVVYIRSQKPAPRTRWSSR